MGDKADFRTAHRVDDLNATLEALRNQLGELQLSQIAHARRAIILFEGPEGSAKKAVLKQLAAAFDPCFCTVHPIQFDRREAADGHWLARYWRALPAGGHTSIFFHSWYRRVLDDRLRARIDEDSVMRLFDEINEFEAQQLDYGTLIVKLYFDVSADVQRERLDQRLLNPWRSTAAIDEPLAVDDPAYVRAFDELKAHSNTRWSPWRMIDGNDEQHAALAALEAIADAWSKAMPAQPPHVVEASVRVA